MKISNLILLQFFISTYAVPPSTPQILVQQRVNSYQISLRGPEGDTFGAPRLVFMGTATHRIKISAHDYANEQFTIFMLRIREHDF